MARDEFWDALKEYAHRNHQERVSKNSDRIAYAIQQFEAHGIEYQLKNRQTGGGGEPVTGEDGGGGNGKK